MVDNPRLAQALGESNAHLRGTLAQAIHNGKECGEVAGDTDESAEAAGSSPPWTGSNCTRTPNPAR